MSQYEFSDVENGTIAATGSRARTWAVLSIVFGSLQMLLGLATMSKGGIQALANLIGGPVSLVIGITILGVASAFKAVVETKGNDVSHMMQALKKLNTAYTIQIVVVAVGFSAGFIGGLMGMR